MIIFLLPQTVSTRPCVTRRVLVCIVLISVCVSVGRGWPECVMGVGVRVIVTLYYHNHHTLCLSPFCVCNHSLLHTLCLSLLILFLSPLSISLCLSLFLSLFISFSLSLSFPVSLSLSLSSPVPSGSFH